MDLAERKGDSQPAFEEKYQGQKLDKFNTMDELTEFVRSLAKQDEKDGIMLTDEDGLKQSFHGTRYTLKKVLRFMNETFQGNRPEVSSEWHMSSIGLGGNGFFIDSLLDKVEDLRNGITEAQKTWPRKPF
jgi:hypothetical protein